MYVNTVVMTTMTLSMMKLTMMKLTVVVNACFTKSKQCVKES